MNCPPAPTEPSPEPRLPATSGSGWTAKLELEYAAVVRAGVSVTAPVLRRHHGPLRAQRYHHPDDSGACQQLVIHPPGGIVGGDELDIRVRAHADADVLLTAPGAAKWYRSAGPRAFQRVALKADAGAHLAWLPQPAIVFDGANVDLTTVIDAASSATVFYWDVLALGRPLALPQPRPMVTGSVRTALTVRVDGRPVLDEVGAFVAGDCFTRSALGLSGHPVFGTFLMAGPAASRGLALARAVQVPRSIRAGVTVREGVLVVRALGTCSEMMFQYFSTVWAGLNGLVLGRAVEKPRIWQT